MLTILVTEEFGRGVYAKNIIWPGEVLTRCEILLLNERDTTILENTELKYYTFTYDQKRDCLVLGLGEIFNHSDQPNVSYQLVEFDGRKVMEFRAMRPIHSGDQCFIDYKADSLNIDAQKYLDQKSMIG